MLLLYTKLEVQPVAQIALREVNTATPNGSSSVHPNNDCQRIKDDQEADDSSSMRDNSSRTCSMHNVWGSP